MALGARSPSEASGKLPSVTSAFNEIWGMAGGGGISTSTAALTDFSASIAEITYSPPVFTRPTLKTATVPAAPSVSAAPSGISLDTFDAGGISAELTTGTLDAPVIGDITLPAAPVASVVPAVPAVPFVEGVTVEAAPVIATSIAALPEVTPLEAAPTFSTALPAAQALQPLTLTPLDDSELDAALSRLQAQRRPVTIPRYTKLLPEVFTAAGALLAGSFTFDALHDGLDDEGASAGLIHDRLLLNLWSSRGLDAGETHIPEYNVIQSARFAEDRRILRGAAVARWSNDMLRVAYDVGTSAHSMAMDIELGLYELEFDALIAFASARLEYVKALIARYNADVILAGVAAEQYGAEMEQVRAAASRYKSRAAVIDAAAQTNGAIADAFSASERAKGAEADTYRAQLATNDARIKALRAQNEAIATRGEAAAVELERYKADVLAWTGAVEQTKAQYTIASAQYRSVQAQNRMEATRQQVTNVRNEAVVAQAQQQVTEASASASRAVAAATVAGSRYAVTELANTVASAKAKLSVGQYQGRVAEYVARLDAFGAELDGWASVGASAVRFASASAESAGRAASSAQEAATKLSRAYEIANDARARGESAMETGRYAGYRASASLNASGGFSESMGYSTSNSASSSTSTDYIDNYYL